MKPALFISAILFFSILASCNRNHNQNSKLFDTQMSELKKSVLSQNSNKKEQQKEHEKIPVGNLQLPSADSAFTPATVKPTSNSDWDKKIIKTANLKIEVKDFKNYNGNIHATIKKFGGYIAQEEQNSTNEKTETAIVIKVPVDQFETMMNELSGGDNKVLERKITSEDVTGQVVDTRLRLEAKKGMRLKYLEFLKQSKNMGEVLQVQNEINSIQEEIESATGRVEFLSHQSAYSTINLTFYQPINGYTPPDAAPSFLTRISTAFKSGATWIADFFIALISIWPLFIFATVIYIGWRKLKPSKIIAQNL